MCIRDSTFKVQVVVPRCHSKEDRNPDSGLKRFEKLSKEVILDLQARECKIAAYDANNACSVAQATAHRISDKRAARQNVVLLVFYVNIAEVNYGKMHDESPGRLIAR